MKDAQVQIMTFGQCTAALCFLLHRYAPWRKETHDDGKGQIGIMSFYRSIRWAIRLYTYTIYVYTILCMLRYHVILFCLGTASWMLPVVAFFASLVLLSAFMFMNWMIVLKLQVLRSGYALLSRRLFFVSFACYLPMTQLNNVSVFLESASATSDSPVLLDRDNFGRCRKPRLSRKGFALPSWAEVLSRRPRPRNRRASSRRGNEKRAWKETTTTTYAGVRKCG